MDQQINYGINFALNGAQLSAMVSQVNSGIAGMTNNFSGAFGRLQQSINRISLTSVLQQINGVADGLQSLAGPGLDLSTSLYDLQAITGVAGDKLKEIEGYARASAETFGGSAAQGVESFKLILSQLAPEIAESPAALNAMGNSVATLSKTMGGDALAATEVLTTAMNQYGISTADPIKASEEMARMMNVMSAAANAGSAEMPQIKGALEQAGMAASAAGVSFEEANAAIQVLDKAGKKGSEGGVALRNVLATLGEGRFMAKDSAKALEAAGVSIAGLADTSRPLAERLAILKPIMGDAALVTKVFGKENSNAALALLGGTEEITRLTTAVTGTTDAYTAAAIVMESPAEKAKRLQASVDDLKISLFNGTNGWMGYVSVLGSATKDVTNLWPAIGMVSKVLGINTIATALQAASTDIASGATTRLTVVQAALNRTMLANPIFLITAGIAALTAGVIYAYNHFETFRGIVWGAWEAVKGFGNMIYDLTIGHILNLVKGIGGLGTALVEVFSGNFSEAADAAKEAVADLSGYNTLNAVYKDGVAMADAVQDGYQDGIADFKGEAVAEAKETGAAVGMAAGTSIKSNMVQSLADNRQVVSAITAALDPTGTMAIVGPAFYAAGKDAANRLADGIIDSIGRVVGAISQLAGDMSGAMNPLYGAVAQFGYDRGITGIAPATIAGQPTTKPDPKGTGNGSGGKASKANEAIATGGAKNTTINITIEKQVGIENLTTGSVQQGTAQMGDAVLEYLTRTIKMGAALGS